MQSIYKVLAVGCCLVAAGCATTAPSPLTLASARSLRLDAINVTVAPDAAIAWGNAEQEYIVSARWSGKHPRKEPVTTTASISDPQKNDSDADRALAATPEGRDYVRGRISRGLSQELDRQLKPAMASGARPTTLEVTVHDFSIPSAMQRVLVGGVPVITASAVLKDAATGEVIARRDRLVAVAMAGNGWGGVLVDQMFSDLDVRVVDNYAEQYKAWLIPEA